MLAIALAVAVHARQAISATFMPTRMTPALAILSRACGLTLHAAGQFDDEVVVACLKDAPVDKALGHLAEAFCAKWEHRSDGSILLVDDPAARNRLDTMRAAQNRKHIEHSLEYVRKRLAEQPEELTVRDALQIRARQAEAEKRRKAALDSGDYDHAFIEPSWAEETPAWRAAARLVPLFGADYLLSLPDSAREVWAERPTRMQHAFPDAAADILARYRRELSQFKPDVQVDRVEVAVLKWEDGFASSADFNGLDHAGKIVDSTDVRLADDSDILKLPGGHGRAYPSPGGESPIELPPEVVRARLVMARSAKDPHQAAYFAELRPHLLNPEKDEPTRTGLGVEAVLSAESLGRNLIGNVGESASLRFWQENRETPSHFLARHSGDFLPEADGWLVLHPQVEEWRAPRRQAGELIRQAVLDGGISLDAAAAWAAKSTDHWPFIEWVGDYVQALVSPGGGEDNEGKELRLWNALGPSFRARLRRGETVRLDEIPLEAKPLVAQSVYWCNQVPEGKPEPTDRLPNGISGGTVSLSVKESPVFLFWASAKGREIGGYPTDPELFASRRGAWIKDLANGEGEPYEADDPFRGVDRYLSGTRRTYTLHYTFTPEAVTMDDEMQEQFFEPSGVPADKMPDELVKAMVRVRAAEAALAKTPATKPRLSIPP